MQGMRFKFHLVDSTSVENQLAHVLVGGIHSLLDGAEVHAGAGLTWYVGVKLGRVRAPSHVCLQVGPVSIVVEKVPTKVSLYYSVQ